MKTCDIFTFCYTLEQLKPEVIIESGVWYGWSTKIIRKTLGDSVKIISIDPMEVPDSGYIDKNINTTYLTGKNFVDFEHLDLSFCKNMDKVLAFFDDHQDGPKRLLQSNEKGIKHVFFNDNYPVNCGSHFTLQHIKNNDQRLNKEKYEKDEIEKLIEVYNIFPNIYPGDIQTMEGLFNCNSYYDNDNDLYQIFKEDRIHYRWNTYIKLK